MVACVSSHTAVLAAGEGKKRRERESPSGRSGGEREKRRRVARGEEKTRTTTTTTSGVCVKRVEGKTEIFLVSHKKTLPLKSAHTLTAR